MITSTFLPAAAPPLPPPLLVDDPLDARPPTTPTTAAISAMTATSDSENFTRPLLMARPFPSGGSSLGLSNPERTLTAASATVRRRSRRVKEYVSLTTLVILSGADGNRGRAHGIAAGNVLCVGPRGAARRQRAAAHHEAGGRRRRGQPGNGLARRQRRRHGQARPRGPRPARRRAAGLPPQPDRQLASPRRPPVGQHRADLRGRLQPVLLGRPPRGRGGGPRARRAHVRRQLRRGPRA